MVRDLGCGNGEDEGNKSSIAIKKIMQDKSAVTF